MAKTKDKTINISIKESKGTFKIFKRTKAKQGDYDFADLLALRQVLSNEKARILDVIKTQDPISIYDLSKKLSRSFKSVSDDVKILEKFGFIQLIEENTKKRKRHKPIIAVDNILINIKI